MAGVGILNNNQALNQYMERYYTCKTFEDLNSLTIWAKNWEKENRRPITPDWYVANGFSTSCSASARKPYRREGNPTGWTEKAFEANLAKWRLTLV